MKIFVKRDNGLKKLGEGKIYSKSQLKLNEDFTNGKVSLTLNPNGQDVRASSVQTSAQNMLHQVPQATAPTFSPNDPRNDTVQQLTTKNASSAAVQNAAKNGGTIQITKDDQQQTAMESKKTSNKIVEMRKNSIPFSKKELSDFLSSL